MHIVLTSKGETLGQTRGNLAYEANNGIFGKWWVVLASASDVIANECAFNSLQSCTVNLAQLHHDLSITFTELENRCDCNLIKKLQTAKNSLPDIPVRDYATSTTVYTSTMYQHLVFISQNHSLISHHSHLTDQIGASSPAVRPPSVPNLAYRALAEAIAFSCFTSCRSNLCKTLGVTPVWPIT